MPLTLSAVIIHLGLLDGSAGVAISDNAFIGASDEVNVLHLHSTTGGKPLAEALNLNEQKDWFPALPKLDDQGQPKKGKFHEVDVESAALVGKDVVYWISSHACSPAKDGKPVEQRKERQVFFATKLETIEGTVKPVPMGKVYRGLLDDLINEPSLKQYKLETSSHMAPKAGPTKVPLSWGGLNIESLCTAKDGKTLLIGFRNPIPDGKALLVPLINPSDVVAGTTKATFGQPIELDLGGLGLRDMVWWKGAYLLIGGDFGDRFEDEHSRPSRLFRWSGIPGAVPTPVDVDLSALNPEVLIDFGKRVLILSDDGALTVLADGTISNKGTKQKDLPGKSHFFRSVWLD